MDTAWQLVALFRQPYAELLFRPILDLHAALRNLDEGGVPPMLKPVRRTMSAAHGGQDARNAGSSGPSSSENKTCIISFVLILPFTSLSTTTSF
jgi:hypothetical protein